MATWPILKEGSTERDKIFELPDGWTKRLLQRQAGATIGSWDAYLYPPPFYKHKRLRSAIELMSFILRHKDAKIDVRYVNLESKHEIVTGGVDKLGIASHKLIEFLEKVKSGQDVKIEDYFSKSQNRKNANRKAALDGAPDGSVVIDKNVKVKQKPKKKTKGEPEIVGPKFNLSQSLKLEKLFHAAATVPTPEQMSEWSTALGVDYNDLHDWFRIKWRARLEYEAAMAKQKEELLEDPSACDESLGRLRKIQRFDVPFSHDPLISHEAANNYYITNEDGEEDVVRIYNDNDVSSDDDLMDCDVALHCGEVTIEEDVMNDLLNSDDALAKILEEKRQSCHQGNTVKRLPTTAEAEFRADKLSKNIPSQDVSSNNSSAKNMSTKEILSKDIKANDTLPSKYQISTKSISTEVNWSSDSLSNGISTQDIRSKDILADGFTSKFVSQSENYFNDISTMAKNNKNVSSSNDVSTFKQKINITSTGAVDINRNANTSYTESLKLKEVRGVDGQQVLLQFHSAIMSSQELKLQTVCSFSPLNDQLGISTTFIGDHSYCLLPKQFDESFSIKSLGDDNQKSDLGLSSQDEFDLKY